MADTSTDFSAKEPSIGWIYQIKYALLLLLTNSRNLDNPVLRIEGFDDIDITDVNSTNLYHNKKYKLVFHLHRLQIKPDRAEIKSS